MSNAILALAASCAYQPGITTCCWIDPDEHVHTESFDQSEGEDAPVFQIVKKEGVTVRFNLGSYTIEYDEGVRPQEPVLQRPAGPPDPANLA